MRLACGWAICISALLLCADGTAHANAKEFDASTITHHPRSIAYYQAYDQHLQNIGWKLARANADYCERTASSIGLQLQDVTTFSDPDVARQTLRLSGDFAVATSAQSSPAGADESLWQNREITHLGTANLNDLTTTKGAKWDRLKRAHDLLDQLLESRDPISITFASGERTEIAPVRACAGRFELAADNDKLVATDERVLIGLKSKIFAYPEDMFASGVAHEFAHMVLGHTAWLDRNGRKSRHTRLTELEADRLMPWLLANAGYDPAAAIRFFEDYRPPSGGVLFVRGSHPRWRERVEAVATELHQVRALIEREGKADWRTHFRRGVDPDLELAKERR